MGSNLFTSSVEPDRHTDSSQGYKQWDRWDKNNFNGYTSYICVDPTKGNAIWLEISHNPSASDPAGLKQSCSEIALRIVESSIPSFNDKALKDGRSLGLMGLVLAEIDLRYAQVKEDVSEIYQEMTKVNYDIEVIENIYYKIKDIYPEIISSFDEKLDELRTKSRELQVKHDLVNEYQHRLLKLTLELRKIRDEVRGDKSEGDESKDR